MHIKGSWRPLQCGEVLSDDNFPHFILHCSESVTILEDKKYKVVYEGVIFDYSDTQILHDPGLLKKAFGYYTYVLIDKLTKEIYIGTDRLGYSALYFAWEDGKFLFSSSPTLLKYTLKKVTMNFDAWDEILSLGDIIGTKTVVSEISRARWGQRFLLTTDTVEINDIWSPEIPPFISRDRYLRANNDLLIESMSLTKDCQREKFIFLTGGQDSRRLAIAAHHLDLPVTCATQVAIGKNGTDEDILIAESVAHCLGQPFISLPLPGNANHFKNTLIKDFWIAYESSYHEWVLPLLRNIPQGSLIYDGIVGDVTVNGHYFVHNPSAITNYSNLDHMTRLVCGERKSLIDAKHMTTPLFERVRAELAQFPDSPHRLTYFYLLNHTRRNIGNWCLLFKLHGHVPCMPYLYHPLFVQSLSLEPKHYVDGWMQMECMKQMHPEAAALPSTREKVPEGYRFDCSSEEKSHMQFAMQNLRMRRDAKRLLPGLERQCLVYETFVKLRLRRYAASSIWAANTVSRFSSYLDWLEDHRGPDFPVTKETVDYLEI